MITIILHWQWHFIRFLWTVFFLFFLLLLFQRYRHNGLWSSIDTTVAVMYIVGPAAAHSGCAHTHRARWREKAINTYVINTGARCYRQCATNCLLYYLNVVRRAHKWWRGCYRPARIPRRGIPSRSTSGLFSLPSPCKLVCSPTHGFAIGSDFGLRLFHSVTEHLRPR